LFSCADNQEPLLPCTDLTSDDISIEEDFKKDCSGAQENIMILNASLGSEYSPMEYLWHFGDSTFVGQYFLLEGEGPFIGEVEIQIEDCTVIKELEIVFPSSLSSISGRVWRESRYFEGGLLNEFDPTDYPSIDILVELLDANTMEVLDRDSTDQNAEYLFDELVTGEYILKFHERVFANTFLWITPNAGHGGDVADSDVNAEGMSDKLVIEACDDIKIDAGYKVCFPDDEDCLSFDPCSYFVKDDDIVITEMINNCFKGEINHTYSLTVPQQAYMSLRYRWDIENEIYNDSRFNHRASGVVDAVLTITNLDCKIVRNFQIDFGIPTANISGLVWQETNVGSYTYNESDDDTVADVLVELLDGNSMEILKSTRTDMDGTYLFEEIVTGDYIVRFADDEMKSFIKKDGASDHHDNDANENGMTDVFTFDSCGDKADIFAGML